MPNTPYAMQFSPVLSKNLTKEKLNHRGVSGVFDKVKCTLSEEQVTALKQAQQEGIEAFGKVMYAQTHAVILQLIDDVEKIKAKLNDKHAYEDEDELITHLIHAVMMNYMQAVNQALDTDMNACLQCNSWGDTIKALVKSPEDFEKLKDAQLMQENESFITAEVIKTKLDTFKLEANEHIRTLNHFQHNNAESLQKANPALWEAIQSATHTLAVIEDALPELRETLTAENQGTLLPPFLNQLDALEQQLTNIMTLAQEEPEVKSIFQPIITWIQDVISSLGYLLKGTAERQVKANYDDQQASIKALSEKNQALKERLKASKLTVTDKNSPAQLTKLKPNKAKNIPADLMRGTDEVTIDGKKLEEYMKEYPGFEDTSAFFDAVLLKKIPEGIDKAPMIDFLTEYFHQDGLLNPVTAAVQNAMIETSTDGRQTMCNFAKPGTVQKRVVITTNESGFNIQENTTIGTLNCVSKYPDPGEPDNPLYEASEGQVSLSAIAKDTPILAATGTVEVDFVANPESPKLTTTENTITYGHPALAEYMKSLHPPTEPFDTYQV